MAKVSVTGPLTAVVPEPTTEHQLVPISEDLFVTRPAGAQTWVPLTFYRLADGTPYVHFGVRATPKVG